jgi:hypothetical protein
MQSNKERPSSWNITILQSQSDLRCCMPSSERYKGALGGLQTGWQLGVLQREPWGPGCDTPHSC